MVFSPNINISDATQANVHKITSHLLSSTEAGADGKVTLDEFKDFVQEQGETLGLDQEALALVRSAQEATGTNSGAKLFGQDGNGAAIKDSSGELVSESFDEWGGNQKWVETSLGKEFALANQGSMEDLLAEIDTGGAPMTKQDIIDHLAPKHGQEAAIAVAALAMGQTTFADGSRFVMPAEYTDSASTTATIVAPPTATGIASPVPVAPVSTETQAILDDPNASDLDKAIAKYDASSSVDDSVLEGKIAAMNESFSGNG